MRACLRPPKTIFAGFKGYSELIPTRMHANSDTHAQRMHVLYSRRMQSVLLLLTPSLHDRSKLKGQCTERC